MSKKRKKSVHKIPPKLPPIVFVPNETYTDDAGDIIPTDIILVSDPKTYKLMREALASWSKAAEKVFLAKKEKSKDD